MSTVNRLEAYGVFSADVIEHVAETQQRLAVYPTYHDVLNQVGEPIAYQIPGNEWASILDILPEECDPRSAILVQLPMAKGLDANQLYMLAGLREQFKNRRIIASGNPNTDFKSGGGLNRWSRKIVSSGDISPTVEPIMRYIERNRIDEVDHLGYSYGAEKAVAAGLMHIAGVRTLTAIEPIRIANRNLLDLASRFRRASSNLEVCVNSNNLMTFKDARENSPGMFEFSAGLLRPTNIAVAKALSKKGFFRDLHELIVESGASATVVWGSESELCDDQIATHETNRLKIFVGDKLQAMRVPGARHAVAVDIAFQNAVALSSIG